MTEQLDESEQQALANIEEYGLHILNVAGEDDLPPFSYSIGIRQPLGRPELIVIDLGADLGQDVINQCYRQMKSGAA